VLARSAVTPDGKERAMKKSKKVAAQKLTLAKETLRNLSAKEQSAVQGGGTWTCNPEGTSGHGPKVE
jgi:hypothetical protein